MRLKKKGRNYNNLVFFCLLVLIFCVGMTILVKEKTPFSMVESRELVGFEHFTLKGFVDGVFQDNFESAFSDQFWDSENIRMGYAQFTSHLPTFGLKENICHNRYIELKSAEYKRGTFNCEDYLLYLPRPLTDEGKMVVDKNIEKYNHINKLTNTYYYFVDDASSFDFERNTRVNDYYSLLEDELKKEKGLDKLKFDSYEEYKNYFYKNDHHWNYMGSYQGFIDIAKLLGIKEVVSPVGENTNHENFFGSYARTTNNYDYPEEFVYYEFDIPEHKTYINGVEGKYNHYEEYRNHDYEYDELMMYYTYAYVYGDDYAEVVFDFDQPEKKNLLIISNSYSNAVNELIAQYFDKTYVVDLRCFKETTGKDFSISDYLIEKDIDEALIIMSPTFITSEEPNRGLES